MSCQGNKKIWIVIIALCQAFVSTAQINKDDISVVQFSAKFVKSSELSLSSYAKDYDTSTLYISEYPELFKKEKIKYLPTIVLYHEGEQVLVITSDLSLKLPPDALKQLDEEINNILKNRF